MVALVAEPVSEQAGYARARARAERALSARPIAVYALAGMPRWVTHEGRRQRVLSVQEQPAVAPLFHTLPAGARRLQVQLAGGSVLTLLHDRRGWRFTPERATSSAAR